MRKTLEFTLKVSSCLGCHFCPQDKLGAAYKSPNKTMDAEDFMFILRALPEDVECHFSGFSEPFLHHRCAEMIAAARLDGHEVHLYTTLIGLSMDGASRLHDSPPNYIRIHVPDKKGLIIPDKKWVEQDYLFRGTGLQASYMAMGEPTDAVKTHLEVHKTVVELPDMLSRGGNLWGLSTPLRRATCSMNRWHSNVVMPNGDVYGCCMDYGLTVPLGNLLIDNYTDILLAGDKWKQNMERDCSGTICAQCEWARPA
jgi:radical SAM protein with 4Fe4S-binding SPASM domain